MQLALDLELRLTLDLETRLALDLELRLALDLETRLALDLETRLALDLETRLRPPQVLWSCVPLELGSLPLPPRPWLPLRLAPILPRSPPSW
jgi:hypothetical protein